MLHHHSIVISRKVISPRWWWVHRQECLGLPDCKGSKRMGVLHFNPPRNQGPQLTPNHPPCLMYSLWISMDIYGSWSARGSCQFDPWISMASFSRPRWTPKRLGRNGREDRPSVLQSFDGTLGMWPVECVDPLRLLQLYAALLCCHMLPYVASLYGKIGKCWHMLTHQIKYIIIYIYMYAHGSAFGSYGYVPKCSNIIQYLL